MKLLITFLSLFFVFSQTVYSAIDVNVYKAVKLNNTKKIKKIINKKNVNYKNNDNETILNYAIIKGNIKVIKYLIKIGADLNNRTKVNYDFTIKKGKIKNSIKVTEENGGGGDTSLILAIKTKNLEIIKLLVKNGSKLNLKGGNTPLNTAIKVNRIDFVKFLLKKGVKFKTTSDSWRIPMILAVENNNIKMLSLLIKSGENINKKNLKQKTALTYSIVSNKKNRKISKKRFKVIKFLLENNAKIGESDLYFAINIGSLKLLNLLIKHGAKVSLEQKLYAQTIIEIISQNGNLDILKKLLINKYDKKILNPALFSAVKNPKNQKMINYLISIGADINYTDKKTGKNILIKAIEVNNFLLVKKIVRKGGNTNFISKYGYTPLMAAINNIKITKYLVKNKAKVRLYNPKFNQSLLSYSISMGNNNNKVIKFLIAKNASTKDSLYNASIKFNREIVELLISKKVKINKKYNGETPLTGAIKYAILFNRNPNIKKVISILIKNNAKLDFKYLESENIKSHKKLYDFVKSEMRIHIK